MVSRISSAELIDRLLDPGSFQSWDAPPVQPHAPQSSAYAEDLARACAKTGLDEAIVTGEGLLDGRRVALVAGEFGFLAGSIGVAAAERLTIAIERATMLRLPLIASPTSGGTRMQEGTVAFLQMVKISAAVAAHKAARLPYLVYLRNPTTGGVFASWGSLGHITMAEPGALIGFLGPRVYEALYGAQFPTGVQLAENLRDIGLLDAVVRPEELRDLVRRTLHVLMPRPDEIAADAVDDEPGEDEVDALVTPEDDTLAPNELPDLHAWHSIELSRRPDRPGVHQLLEQAATEVLYLSGTTAGETDSGMLLALVRFGTSSCVVAAQDRHGQTLEAPLGPAALREARRGMQLAAELHLPLVTVIDTPGAALSKEAEEGGLAGEIARCLHDMVTLPAPTLSVLLGQGSGGAALALIPADHTIAAQHAWLSPLPPEGASAIVHRTVDKAPQMAHAQGVRALDLHANGIVDWVVAELPDAAEEPLAFCRRIGRAIHRQLAELEQLPDEQRMAARLARYRRLGL
ncbi:MAG: acetyl-CoA carboxylase carboxyltransferase subunit alpha/beta [Austwickia sp.]|nr:acetyl-CoA carboxylase carboxyltransferase subunit alpha/beta [Austwickia sp.]